jgi:group I intron endonuclease
MTNVGMVYKIINSINNDIYVGSTIRTLNQRFAGHKCNHSKEDNRSYNCKLFTAMRELDIDNFSIHLLECIEFEGKDLLICEQKHIEELKPAYNTNNSYNIHPRGSAELNHRHYVNSIAKQSDETKADRKTYVKNWTTENKAQVVEYKKQLYIKDKAVIQEKRRNTPMVSCPCSLDISRQFKEYNRSVHNKNKTHKAWLLLQSESF